MKKLISLILVVLLACPILCFAGCGSESEVTVLRICNCEDYIDEELIEQFEEENPDIDVVYSTYGTNENLYNELVINPNSYDLVVPSEYMIEKLAEEGRIKRLDLSKVPNYQQNVSQYINQRIGDITVDIKEGEQKGQKYPLTDFMVGYMWGTMGWVYNRDFVKDSEVTTWNSIFEKQSLNKKITIKDSIRDSYIVGLALVYGEELAAATSTQQITDILNRVDKEAVNAVGEKLISLKPMLYGFEVDSGKNDIILGNINAYVAWSGDAAYAIDVAAGRVEDEDGNFLEGTKLRDLSYKIPEEGSNIWFDGFVMPTGSTNEDAAYKFLNFISAPDSAVANMDYIGYTSMVACDEVYEYIYDTFDEFAIDTPDDQRQEVDLYYFFGRDNEVNNGQYTVSLRPEDFGRLTAQYPTEEMAKRCAVMRNFNGETLLAINDMWEGVKGETFPTWLIITLIALVVVLGVVILLYRYKDKIKWFKFNFTRKTYAEKHNLKVIKKEFIK